jgi:hypothetical protein
LDLLDLSLLDLSLLDLSLLDLSLLDLCLLDLSLLDLPALLGLRRTSQNQASDDRGSTDAKNHHGLTGNFPGGSTRVRLSEPQQ